MVRSESSGHDWPVHGWVGLALVLIFWILNWSLPGLRTQWAFFPLWLGYCLTIDALVYQRKGHSLLTRNPRAYIGLFFISVPIWWLFEIVNWRTRNWFYDGRQYFSDLFYFGFASLSFSTVMPAVFGTAEWIGSFDWLQRMRLGLVIQPTSKVLWRFFGAGWLMLGLLLIWPDYFFPFVWISLYFILEPVNVWLKNRSLAPSVAVGDWRPVFALWIGVLICAFFWEMWNFYAYPKWTYRVPFVDFWHIFEMPLLGYGGYLPFSLELLALYHLAIGVFKQDSALDLVVKKESIGK